MLCGIQRQCGEDRCRGAYEKKLGWEEEKEKEQRRGKTTRDTKSQSNAYVEFNRPDHYRRETIKYRLGKKL